MKEYRDHYRGLSIGNAESAIRKLKNLEKPKTSDAQNRSYVLSKISRYIKNGMSKNEAIDLIMQDEDILIKFEYLTKNGLDLRTCFTNWISSIERTEEYRSIEKDRDER